MFKKFNDLVFDVLFPVAFISALFAIVFLISALGVRIASPTTCPCGKNCPCQVAK